MNIKEVVLTVAIVVLTVFVTVYGINTFYARPDYNNFCEEYKPSQYIETFQDCDLAGGYWNYYNAPQQKIDVGTMADGYCDLEYYCRQDYDNSMSKWMRNVFFIGVPLGILIILLGMFIFGLDFVGAGLMWGGLVTIIYSSWGFFWETADWVRFVISLVALAIIIWVGYKSNKGSVKKVSKKKLTRKK